MEADAARDAQLGGEPLERRSLGAVADDVVAQLGMAVAQQPERAQDVGVALARHEMGDGDERLEVALRRLRRELGAEVHDRGTARAQLPRAGGDAGRVGEHERGVLQPAADGGGART